MKKFKLFAKFKLFTALLIILLALNVWAASTQTSSTTGTALITQVRYDLNDTDASEYFWSDTEILQWLNDGMVDIVSKTHCLEATESVSLVADTIEYALSSTYTTVRAVTYTDASSNVTGLEKGNIESVGGSINRSAPAFWYEWNAKIGIYPALSSVTTETVTVYLITRPTAIVVGSNITTPAIYDKALKYYILAQSMKKDRQFAKAAQYMGEYEAELNRYRADFTEQLKGTVK